MRYVDDAVLVFSEERDARRVMKALPKQFGRYGLTAHPEKTRAVRLKPPRRDSGKALIKSKMIAYHVIPIWGVSSPARLATSPAAKSRYVPRRPNVLRVILCAHFEGFAAIYDRLYARDKPMPWEAKRL